MSYKLQPLNKEFTERYFEEYKTPGYYILKKKMDRYPNFLYYPEDSAIYVESKDGQELILISYEITTVGLLEQWLQLNFGAELPF